MDAALKYSVLDIKALRPYVWALLAPLIVLVPVAWVEPALLISTLPLLLVIMASSFVFSLDESAGLNLLHTMLPGTKAHAVYGRYAVLVGALLVALSVAMCTALMFVVAGQSTGQGYGVITATAISTSLIFLSIQVPLFIRFGYTKARYWGYAIFLVVLATYGALLWIFPSLAVRLMSDAWPLLMVAVALGVFVSSAIGAAKAAEKREI